MNEILERINQKISIVSDEISDDFLEVSKLANALFLRNFELRSFSEGRFPDIDESTLQQLLYLKDQFNYNYTLISPGFFKHEIEDFKKTEKQLNKFNQCLTLAKILGVQIVSTFTFKRVSIHSDIPKDIYEPLLRLKSLCEENSLTLLIENSPNCWADNAKNLLDITEFTGLQANWDPGNSLKSGCSNHNVLLPKLLPITKNIHLKNWEPIKGYCSILSGSYDLASEINYFLEHDYTGYFCIEHHQWNNRKASTIKNYNELKKIIYNSIDLDILPKNINII